MTNRITLAIFPDGWGELMLEDGDGMRIVGVRQGDFSSRPDPIRRAWQHLEANRGMSPAPKPPAPPAGCAQVPSKDFPSQIDPRAPQTPLKSDPAQVRS